MAPNPNSVAVLAIDPGGTTGCAAGLFDLRQPTVASCMRRARSKKNLISWEVGGDHVMQVKEIMAWFMDWHYRILIERSLVAYGKFHIAIERFTPRQLNFEPIAIEIVAIMDFVVHALLERDAMYLQYSKQEPAQRWADDKWLKKNGLYVPSNHERDARRHLGTKLNDLLG